MPEVEALALHHGLLFVGTANDVEYPLRDAACVALAGMHHVWPRGPGNSMSDCVLFYTVGRPLSRDVLFSLSSSGYQLGCTVAAVSAQQPVEHVHNALQNITTEWTPHSVVMIKRVMNPSPLIGAHVVEERSLEPLENAPLADPSSDDD